MALNQKLKNTIPDKELLLKLYDFTNQLEIVHINLAQRTFNIFIGLNLAIIGGVFAINKDIPDIFIRSSSFGISGLLVIFISEYASQGFQLNYRRQLESIVIKGKIEEILNLDDPVYYGKNYWTKEGLILERYTDDRKKSTSSKKFVEDRKKKGFAKTVKNVFRMFQILGIILIILGFYQFFHA